MIIKSIVRFMEWRELKRLEKKEESLYLDAMYEYDFGTFEYAKKIVQERESVVKEWSDKSKAYRDKYLKT